MAEKKRNPIPWIIAAVSTVMMLYLSFKLDRSIYLQYELDVLITRQDSLIQEMKEDIYELGGDSAAYPSEVPLSGAAD